MTLLSDADIAAIRAIAEDTSVSMPLLAAIERPAAKVAGKAGPPTMEGEDIKFGVWGATGTQVQTLQDLGKGRATLLGTMPWGTDVRPRDVLIVGADRYQVHGVNATGVDQVLLALSKQERGSG